MKPPPLRPTGGTCRELVGGRSFDRLPLLGWHVRFGRAGRPAVAQQAMNWLTRIFLSSVVRRLGVVAALALVAFIGRYL